MAEFSREHRLHLIALSKVTYFQDMSVLLVFYSIFLSTLNYPWVVCAASVALFFYVQYTRDDLPDVLYMKYWKSLLVICFAHVCVLMVAELSYCWYDGNNSPHPTTVGHLVYLYILVPSTFELWIIFSDKSLYYDRDDFHANQFLYADDVFLPVFEFFL
ncbi:unnamed protein product [Caenorhabditis brenneri]